MGQDWAIMSLEGEWWPILFITFFNAMLGREHSGKVVKKLFFNFYFRGITLNFPICYSFCFVSFCFYFRYSFWLLLFHPFNQSHQLFWSGCHVVVSTLRKNKPNTGTKSESVPFSFPSSQRGHSIVSQFPVPANSHTMDMIYWETSHVKIIESTKTWHSSRVIPWTR